MDPRPDEIRRRIEDTRDDMAYTADQLRQRAEYTREELVEAVERGILGAIAGLLAAVWFVGLIARVGRGRRSPNRRQRLQEQASVRVRPDARGIPDGHLRSYHRDPAYDEEIWADLPDFAR